MKQSPHMVYEALHGLASFYLSDLIYLLQWSSFPDLLAGPPTQQI